MPLTPELLLEAIKDESVSLGFTFGDSTERVFVAGKMTEVTDSGRTLTTDLGLVFKHRPATGHYTLSGHPATRMLLLRRKG
jgi:hypothetical protein